MIAQVMSNEIPNIQIDKAPDVQKVLEEALNIKESIFKNLTNLNHTFLGQIAEFVNFISF
jgi:hypothetical protein